MTRPTKGTTKRTRAPRPPGRPTLFTEELAAEICARIADGKSIRQLDAMDDMPSKRTILNWLSDPKRASFLQAYAAAGLHRGEALVEEALEVSRQTLERSKTVQLVEVDGEQLPVTIDKAEVAAARLYVDTLMRRAGQLSPKKLGPLMRLAGEDGGALPLIIRRARDVDAGSDG